MHRALIIVTLLLISFLNVAIGFRVSELEERINLIEISLSAIDPAMSLDSTGRVTVGSLVNDLVGYRLPEQMPPGSGYVLVPDQCGNLKWVDDSVIHQPYNVLQRYRGDSWAEWADD
jgi:hypothetical protein